MKVLQIRDPDASFDIRDAILEAIEVSTRKNVICITYSHNGMVIFVAPNQKIENILRDHERALLGSIGLAIGPYYKDVLSDDEKIRDKEFEKKRDKTQKEAQQKREMREEEERQRNSAFIKEQSGRGGEYQFSQRGEFIFEKILSTLKKDYVLYGKEDIFLQRVKLLGSVMQGVLGDGQTQDRIVLFNECIVKFEDLNEAGITRQITWDVISRTWFYWEWSAE